MSTSLQHKLKQNASFKNKAHEATLSVLVAAVHIRKESEAIFKKYDLTFSYYNVLRILRGGPEEGYPRCDIIERMIDPAPDVTRLIDHLINKGWVRRARSEHDRRVSLHWITDEGRTLLNTMDAEINAINARYESRLSEDDLDTLIRICSEIYSQDSFEREC